MKIGICLPYMKAGLSREDYQAWFQSGRRRSLSQPLLR